MSNIIDWGKISKAVEYYQKQGYTYTEVPWMVSKKAKQATFDGPCYIPPEMNKHLVGSGEQSFVQMMLDNRLKEGNYVCVTPCFRRRDSAKSRLHLPYFMKCELIVIKKDNGYSVLDTLDILGCAMGFFTSLGADPKIVETDEGYDLEHKGIEIGSYGVRESDGLSWVYGTGIAEPRFSASFVT